MKAKINNALTKASSREAMLGYLIIVIDLIFILTY